MSGAWVSVLLLATLGIGGCTPASPGVDDEVGAAGDRTAESSTTPGRILISGGAGQERIDAYHVMSSAALARVEDLWGPGSVRWSVRVVLPATGAEFDRLTGSDPGADVPATTVGALRDAHIVVHPDSWDRLTPEGRQAVLTHEVTHLRQQGDGPVPTWLGEGLAEYTAHRGSDVPPSAVAGSALDGVRAGRLPTAWPDPTETSGDWGSYALSWLACLYVAETWSEDALLDLYQTVADGTPLSQAFPLVMDTTEDAALAGWTGWLGGLTR